MTTKMREDYEAKVKALRDKMAMLDKKQGAVRKKVGGGITHPEVAKVYIEIEKTSIALHKAHIENYKKELADAKKKKASSGTIMKIESSITFHLKQIKSDEEAIKEHQADVAKGSNKDESLKGNNMKPAKQLMSVIESLDSNGELEELPVGEPIEAEIEDITDVEEDAGETTIEDDGELVIEEEEDELEDDEEVEMTEEELDAEIEKEEKELTEEEIEAEKASDEDEDGIFDEAKTTFPKDRQIKSLRALTRKNKKALDAKKLTLIQYKNQYAKADRRGKLAITKKRKALEAEMKKISNVMSRASEQRSKLEAQRKVYNKKNRAAKKAAVKK